MNVILERATNAFSNGIQGQIVTNKCTYCHLFNVIGPIYDAQSAHNVSVHEFDTEHFT